MDRKSKEMHQMRGSFLPCLSDQGPLTNITNTFRAVSNMSVLLKNELVNLVISSSVLFGWRSWILSLYTCCWVMKALNVMVISMTIGSNTIHLERNNTALIWLVKQELCCTITVEDLLTKNWWAKIFWISLVEQRLVVQTVEERFVDQDLLSIDLLTMNRRFVNYWAYLFCKGWTRIVEQMFDAQKLFDKDVLNKNCWAEICQTRTVEQSKALSRHLSCTTKIIQY